ncbi:MAG: STAS domain-containing protein [Acidobacteria bacterium]|nr:STAS domain-containing protein [Acidobacteriota bacterium]
MNISRRTVGDVCVLDIDGPITLGPDSAEKLGSTVQGAVAGGESRILLNLAGVAYVDSAGLGELVGAFQAVKKSGGTLKLTGVTKKLMDLLVITKLASAFEMFDTEAAAVASYGA